MARNRALVSSGCVCKEDSRMAALQECIGQVASVGKPRASISLLLYALSPSGSMTSESGSCGLAPAQGAHLFPVTLREMGAGVLLETFWEEWGGLVSYGHGKAFPDLTGWYWVTCCSWPNSDHFGWDNGGYLYSWATEWFHLSETCGHAVEVGNCREEEFLLG